jgi:glycerol kinase
VAWTLSGGTLHVTDATNAAVTGLQNRDVSGWDESVLAKLGIPVAVMPKIIDSAGFAGEARALPGAPPITALVGDQQASLVGQGCVRRGDAKITFGTGGMLDVVLDETPPRLAQRSEHGTFPIVACATRSRCIWGVEALLAAGTSVQWLRDDLGIIASSDGIARARGVVCRQRAWCFVRTSDSGLRRGTGACGALRLTRHRANAEIARAVLEGIAHRGADLVDAAEADSGITIPHVRVDGGMTDNPTFVQALADATQRPVEISPVREATGLGAGLLAGIPVGHHASVDELATTWKPRETVAPSGLLDRDRWRDAVERSRRWIPELSGIDF